MSSHNTIRCRAMIFVSVIAITMAGSITEAGFRPAESQKGRSDSARKANDGFKKSSKPTHPEKQSRVAIHRKGNVLNMVNRAGVTDLVEIDPDETVNVEVTRPGLLPGTRVFVFTLHGGRINGNLTDSVVINEDGVLIFDFTANKWFGNYPVVMRINGQDEEVGFWVNKREESK